MTPAAPIPTTPVLPAEIDKSARGWANRPGVSPSPSCQLSHALLSLSHLTLGDDGARSLSRKLLAAVGGCMAMGVEYGQF